MGLDISDLKLRIDGILLRQRLCINHTESTVIRICFIWECAFNLPKCWSFSAMLIYSISLYLQIVPSMTAPNSHILHTEYFKKEKKKQTTRNIHQFASGSFSLLVLRVVRLFILLDLWDSIRSDEKATARKWVRIIQMKINVLLNRTYFQGI